MRNPRYVIAVPDLETSAGFYRDVLGFEVHEIDDPGWRFFVRGSCVIMAGECPDAIPPDQLGDHSWFAYIEVDGIDELHDAVASKARIVSALVDEPWGMREFGIRTADGHRIKFGSPVGAMEDASTSSDEASTRRATWIAAVNAGDADRYAALVTEDVVWVPPSHEPLQGREAFRAWLKPFVESYSYELELSPSASHESGPWAWERGAFRSRMQPRKGGDPHEHGGRYFVLWRRGEDGTWRIERYVDGMG